MLKDSIVIQILDVKLNLLIGSQNDNRSLIGMSMFECRLEF